MQETWEMQVWSLGREDPRRRKWRPTPVFLPRESHGQTSLAGYSPRGHKRLGHGWGTNTALARPQPHSLTGAAAPGGVWDETALGFFMLEPPRTSVPRSSVTCRTPHLPQLLLLFLFCFSSFIYLFFYKSFLKILLLVYGTVCGLDVQLKSNFLIQKLGISLKFHWDCMQNVNLHLPIYKFAHLSAAPK